MTVKELFEAEKISKDLFEEFLDEKEAPYWESAEKFIQEKWTDPINSLSPKQAAWVDKILEDVVEWRIEKRK